LLVRPYGHSDEPGVLDLLTASLGGGPVGRRLPEFFRWKHLENPFGPSFMLVAEAEGRIVGLRAFMRWQFREGDRIVRAVRAVDTATHPDHQGRGVFSMLTKTALDALRGEADLVFNTPNEKSLPGYLKMGWSVVGAIPVAIRVRKPLRFTRGLRSLTLQEDASRAGPHVDADSATAMLRDGPGVEALLQEVPPPAGVLTTPRTVEYLRWRYGAAPRLDYRVVTEHAQGRLCGAAIFRVRARGTLWESTVAELIARRDDGRTVRRLLRRVRRAASVDHVACHLPAAFAPARAAFSGFVRAPRGVTFVVNPLRRELDPDPTDLRSWILSLGDIEVF
jgi:GNAT superfamily N-acetyltransferase